MDPVVKEGEMWVSVPLHLIVTCLSACAPLLGVSPRARGSCVCGCGVCLCIHGAGMVVTAAVRSLL